VLNIFKDIFEDLKNMEKATKVFFSVLILSLAICLTVAITGCYGPSKGYADTMKARADHHMPVYKSLVNTASKEQLSKALNDPELLQADEKLLKSFKESALLEIDGWKYLINAEQKLIKGGK